MRHGVVNELVLRYLDRERPQLTARYPDFERFDAGFAVSPAMMSELAEMAAVQGNRTRRGMRRRSRTGS